MLSVISLTGSWPCSVYAQRVFAPHSMTLAGREEAEGQLSSHIYVWNVLCSEPRKESEQCTIWSLPLKTLELVGETGHPCASRRRTVQRHCVTKVNCELWAYSVDVGWRNWKGFKAKVQFHLVLTDSRVCQVVRNLEDISAWTERWGWGNDSVWVKGVLAYCGDYASHPHLDSVYTFQRYSWIIQNHYRLKTMSLRSAF